MAPVTLLGVMLLLSLGATEDVSEAYNTTSKADLQLSRRFRFDYEFNEKAGGWLKLHEVPAAWQEARLRCHSEGAVLASPLTPQLLEATVEFAWENKYFTSTTSTAVSTFLLFTGLHSTFSKGDYASVEGTPLSRMSVTWAEGEPDNLNNSENCIVIDAANMGVMADKRCNDAYPYVCYKKAKELKINNECGTTDSEYKLEPTTGSCYKTHHTKRIWARAYQTCAGEGGHLAIANSDNESRVLANRIGNDCTYIGFHDWGSSGREWMTIHGETLAEAGYASWAGGEPNNVTNTATGDMGEFCGGMNRLGQLNDMACHYPSPFICELTPGSILLPNSNSNHTVTFQP